MYPYLLFIFIYYPLLCQSVIRIPLKNSRRESNRWKREIPETDKPVLIYDPATYGMIEVGTPPQIVPILFDTYSEFHWLFKENCTTDICSFTERFDSSISNTNVHFGSVDTYEYKAFNMTGRPTNDTFVLDDLKVINLTYVEVMDTGWNVTKERSNLAVFAGAIAMLCPFETNDTDLLSHLLIQGAIPERVIGLKVPRYNDLDDVGELVLGDWDQKYTDGSKIIWTSLVYEPLWTVHILWWVYGNMRVADNYGLIDTGLSIIVGPMDHTLRLFDEIGKITAMIPIIIMSYMSTYEGYAVKCSETLPSLTFCVEHQNYTITSKDYLLPMDDLEGWCAVAIVPDFFNDTMEWRLGDVFLSTVYTIFAGDDYIMALFKYDK